MILVGYSLGMLSSKIYLPEHVEIHVSDIGNISVTIIENDNHDTEHKHSFI